VISGDAETTARAGEERVGLVRDLGLFDVTMVGVGAMIGAGIFVLTGIAAGTAGPALLLAFALNGVVTILTAMVYAELGSAIPEAGGGYLWVKEGLPAWNAFLAGWMSWFAHAVAGSLYALGFGSYLVLVLEEIGVSPFGLTGDALQKCLAVAVAVAFVAINFKGVSETGSIGNLVTMGKIAILGVFVASGLFAVAHHPESMDKLVPFAPQGLGGVLMAMGLTYIAFEGYEIIVQAGEEVKNPRRNIPRAIFLSLAIVIPIYLLVAFTALTAVNPESGEPTWRWLGAHAELGLAEAARQFMPFGTILLLVGGIFSTMSALNATTFSSTRVSFAMGRDRNLPDAFGRIHESTHTPFLALLFSGALIVTMALAIPIEDVAAAADVMFLLLFLQVNVAVITIRRKYGDKLDYGYLIPFFPVLPAVNMGLIAFLALFMFRFSSLAWMFVLGWLGVGFALYLGYARRREREKTTTPVIIERRGWEESDRERVLVPLARGDGTGPLLEIAARIARPLEAEIVLLNVVTVPPQTPLRAGRRLVQRSRRMLEEAGRLADDLGAPVHPLVRIAHHPADAIVDSVIDGGIEWVVMGWHRRSRPGRNLGRNIDPVMQRTRGTVLAVEEKASIPAGRVVVPIARPRSVRILLGIARRLADDSGRIVALHVVPPHLDPDVREPRIKELRDALELPGPFDAEGEDERVVDPRIEFRVVESASVAAAVGRESRAADLVLVGSSEKSWFRRRVFGRTPYWAARRAACPVILVNHGTHPVKFSFQTFFQFFRETGERRKR
jgi:amino acid transporter/nucleotide-binding universal stress UspA family protein